MRGGGGGAFFGKQMKQFSSMFKPSKHKKTKEKPRHTTFKIA
jgi:hypothetical protein